MGKNMFRKISGLFISICIISIGINAFAHSGRTDKNGGHKDKNNVSGLGSYHYHCGGHPAHLHTNGVCPYSSSSSYSQSSSSNNNITNSSYSNNSSITKPSATTKTISTVPTTIVATGIQINESITSMKVGESQKLTATITPDNVTDKIISWSSSDDSIAAININGEVVAKKPGTIDITATTSNGMTSLLKINIEEDMKVENNSIMRVSTTGKINETNNKVDSNLKGSNPIGGILTLGVLGVGGYWGYRKLKK